MASITTTPNDLRLIQFVAGDGKRKTIRLGKSSLKTTEKILVKVEALHSAAIANISWDVETAKWVAGLSDGMADKLAAVGLIPKRREHDATRLAEFLDAYINRRTDVKPNTRRNLEACKARLIDFFGPGRALQDMSPGDADAFLLFLREKGYANGTVGRTVKRAKQFLRAGVRQRLISENPFAEVKPPSQVNESRKFFVDLQTTCKILDACPDAEWRLLFALSRYGGLRCPSEHLALEWSDVDWERDRFRVNSSKTEHLEAGGVRWVPIFPELRPYLEEAFELAPERTVYVINRYRDTNANLRTQLNRIIRRAGVEPWPKLFHNLRASRETELAGNYPIHVVCTWIGNTERIAAKHYLQVTEDYFKKAARGAAESGAVALQNPVQQPPASSRTKSQETQKTRENSGFLQECAIPCEPLQIAGVPPRGLEPLS
jgi:integrase